MDDFWNDPEFNPYLAYISGGFFAFVCVNYLTNFSLPANIRGNNSNFIAKWKWKNTLTSFTHSLLTGIWAPLAFFAEPELAKDMIRGFSPSAHALVCFSVGYFVYDFVDMFLYTWHKRSTKEMLVHHLTVVLCFGIAAVNRTYVAYAAISLVVEVNSVFLHARQLLKFCGVPKSAVTYRWVALLNLLTYVFFRILLLGWMTRWLTLHRDDIPLLFFTIGSLGLASIVAINIVNFYRILVSDFINPNQQKEKEATKILASAEAALDKIAAASATNGNGTSSSESSNGFHPVSKDVNRIVNSLFNPDAGDKVVDHQSSDISSSNCKSTSVLAGAATPADAKKFN